MFRKVVIHLIRTLLVVSLTGGIVTSPGAVDLPERVEFSLAHASEQASSLLYLPITLKGSAKTTIFGLEMRNISGQEKINAVTAADTEWVRRNGLIWSNVEPIEGTYIWNSQASLEQELITAYENGLRVILVVRSTPEWAQEDKDSYCGPIKENKLAAFSEFLYQAVKRYSVPPYNVKYWEIWNEQEIDHELVLEGRLANDSQYGCWGDTNDPYAGGGDYAEVLKAVYPKIKNANPGAQVIVGGMLMMCNPEINENCISNEINYFEGILRHHEAYDGGNYFDVVAFHAYDYYFGRLGIYGNTWWKSGWNSQLTLTKKADFLRSVMERYNIDKPLMVTETALLCGYYGTEPMCALPDFENTKAAYVAQSYASALASGIKANIWYSLTGSWRANQLLDSELNPLPAYYAYSTVVNSLEDVSFSRELNEYPDVNGYEFKYANHLIWFVWSRVSDRHQNVSPVQMDLPATPLKIWDMFGQNVPVEGPSITVTGMPLYIELSIP
ncbi:MAG: glycoside hydrolase family 5 protein [Anaerolineales bacterium]|nr:glycoside hydrolase family 5 protein [Anaerolineales bacterium]